MSESTGLPEYLRTFADWKALADGCDTIEGLDDSEREKVKRAFLFLSDEFGEDFLPPAFLNQHPLTRLLVNQAAWTRKWIAWLADAIRRVKTCENYASLLKRLKDADRCAEAMSVLNVAHRFIRVGLAAAFDPEVQVGNARKKPDLLVCDRATDDHVYIEISILQNSMNWVAAQETMDAITRPLHGGPTALRWCGVIQKSLSKPHLADVVQRVEQTCEKAGSSGSFEELVIEGVLALAVAPESKKDLVDAWGQKRGMKSGSFLGPDVNTDEVPRIKHKIRAEQGQLPPDCAGLVVIPTIAPSLIFRDLGAAVAELEETVYDYPHLLGAVISGGFTGAGEGVVTHIGHHYFAREIQHDIHSEEFLFLLNRFCRVKIAPSAVTKVQATFRRLG